MEVFRDKVAIVTGAASGIGRAVAERLGRSGARVVLADINADLLSKTADALRANGVNTHTAIVDVRDARRVQSVVDDTVAEHGRIDYMFNNAGIAIIGQALLMSLDDWKRTIDVNLHGVVHGIVAAYPIMARQGFGHIVNTASLAGLAPSPGFAAYSATKHAVVGLSTSLRAEAALYGVKVSAVCPGLIETPLVDNSELRDLDRKTMREQVPFKFYPVDACARDLLRGVAKNRPVIVVTGHARALSRVYRFIPALFHRFAVRQARIAFGGKLAVPEAPAEIPAGDS